MKVPVARMAKVSKVAHAVEMSEDQDLRRLGISCLNELSQVRRCASREDPRGAEEALRRAERMAERILSWT